MTFFLWAWKIWRWVTGSKLGQIALLLFGVGATLLGLKVKWTREGKAKVRKQHLEQTRKNLKERRDVENDVGAMPPDERRKWLQNFSGHGDKLRK